MQIKQQFSQKSQERNQYHNKIDNLFITDSVDFDYTSIELLNSIQNDSSLDANSKYALLRHITAHLLQIGEDTLREKDVAKAAEENKNKQDKKVKQNQKKEKDIGKSKFDNCFDFFTRAKKVLTKDKNVLSEKNKSKDEFATVQEFVKKSNTKSFLDKIQEIKKIQKEEIKNQSSLQKKSLLGFTSSKKNPNNEELKNSIQVLKNQEINKNYPNNQLENSDKLFNQNLTNKERLRNGIALKLLIDSGVDAKNAEATLINPATSNYMLKQADRAMQLMGIVSWKDPHEVILDRDKKGYKGDIDINVNENNIKEALQDIQTKLNEKKSDSDKDKDQDKVKDVMEQLSENIKIQAYLNQDIEKNQIQIKGIFGLGAKKVMPYAEKIPDKQRKEILEKVATNKISEKAIIESVNKEAKLANDPKKTKEREYVQKCYNAQQEKKNNEKKNKNHSKGMSTLEKAAIGLCVLNPALGLPLYLLSQHKGLMSALSSLATFIATTITVVAKVATVIVKSPLVIGHMIDNKMHGEKKWFTNAYEQVYGNKGKSSDNKAQEFDKNAKDFNKGRNITQCDAKNLNQTMNQEIVEEIGEQNKESQETKLKNDSSFYTANNTQVNPIANNNIEFEKFIAGIQSNNNQNDAQNQSFNRFFDEYNDKEDHVITQNNQSLGVIYNINNSQDSNFKESRSNRNQSDMEEILSSVTNNKQANVRGTHSNDKYVSNNLIGRNRSNSVRSSQK